MSSPYVIHQSYRQIGHSTACDLQLDKIKPQGPAKPESLYSEFQLFGGRDSVILHILDHSGPTIVPRNGFDRSHILRSLRADRILISRSVIQIDPMYGKLTLPRELLVLRSSLDGQ